MPMTEIRRSRPSFRRTSRLLSCCVWALVVSLLALAPAWGSDAPAGCVIFQPENLPGVQLNHTDAQLSPDGTCAQFTAHGEKYRWPGPIFRGNWDLSACRSIRFTMTNRDTEAQKLCIRVDDARVAETGQGWFSTSVQVEAGATVQFDMPIPKAFPQQLAGKVVGMRGLPGGFRSDAQGLDWSRIMAVFVFTADVNAPVRFDISRVEAQAAPESPTASATATARDLCDWQSMSESEFFPFIDAYGQFRYQDWPGKIHSDDEFPARIAAEDADRAAHPRPANWDRFGGWADGPKLQATGRFRVEKVQGRWWFVDPDGHLFWSHGVDCVGTGNGVTPISHRERYFAELPGPDAPGSRFYGSAWGSMGFYKDKGQYRSFNFTLSNLARKYGEGFLERHNALAHDRLASWGMNTIGNWSDARIYGQRRTPYVLTLSAMGRMIEGSTGYWGKFPDPYSDEFRQSLRDSLRSRQEYLGDPWCLGAFVNNEISWGGEFSLAQAALASPPDQPVKRAFLTFLRKKYDSVDALNAAWNATYASWEAVLESVTPPDTEEMRPDLGEFYTQIALQYFRVIHEELRAADPLLLDMGCRFAWVNDRAARAMAQVVDVMSYNRYRTSVADFRLPEGVDMPCIIGEFHFGALDRGMFHTGLVSATDQNARAQMYYDYVAGALEHPNLVGTHWFQYGSQATTGRFDGENYQIGLLDLTDTPYPEILAKVRQIGREMYPLRATHDVAAE